MDAETQNPLEALAAALRERRCRAAMFGESLTVCPPASARGERVITRDGEAFRWGSGLPLGPVGDVAASADRALSVLEASTR